MFDLTSSKLLILAVVALIVVGPKDLPALLRTVGRYMGMLRRQANEFRAQFDEAMRESELADLKKEVEQIGQETQATLKDAGHSVESSLGDLNRELDQTASDAHRVASGDGLPTSPATPALTSGESMPVIGDPQWDLARNDTDTLSPVPPSSPSASLATDDPGAVEPAPVPSPMPPIPAEPRSFPTEPAPVAAEPVPRAPEPAPNRAVADHAGAADAATASRSGA